MSWLEYLHVFIIFMLAIPYGILIRYYKGSIFNLPKTISKFINFRNFLLLFFPLIGVLITIYSIYVKLDFTLISHITVGLLGFSGVIFTFLIGNLLKNKSDITKNLNDLNLQRHIYVKAQGGKYMPEYEKMLRNYENDKIKNDQTTKKVFLNGFLTIFLFVISLLGLMMLSSKKQNFIGTYYMIFLGIFIGLDYLILTFDNFYISIQE